jgi:hypothetical protein
MILEKFLKFIIPGFIRVLSEVLSRVHNSLTKLLNYPPPSENLKQFQHN